MGEQQYSIRVRYQEYNFYCANKVLAQVRIQYETNSEHDTNMRRFTIHLQYLLTYALNTGFLLAQVRIQYEINSEYNTNMRRFTIPL